MSVDQSAIVELVDWFDTPAGKYVLDWERRQIDAMVANVFGFHAIQLGLAGHDLLQANRIPYRGRVAELPGLAAAQGAALAADPAHLPFEAQSLDLLLLPHVLEASEDPHQILREATRVLVPEGRLVLTGFNPWSLWGARERLPGLEPLLPVPAHAQVSLPRLKDWFKLLDLELDRGRFGAYAPPCVTEKWLRRWRFLEAAGDRWWPVCGAVYALSAVKRVPGVKLLRPDWKKKSRRRARRAAVVAGSPTGLGRERAERAAVQD